MQLMNRKLPEQKSAEILPTPIIPQRVDEAAMLFLQRRFLNPEQTANALSGAMQGRKN
jgi:hypothetical protein